MRRSVLFLVPFLFLASVLFAQKAPVAVDIPTAQQEIDELTQQNNDMASENSQYESENSTLRSEIDAMEALKRDIFVVQGKISSQAGELYSIMQTVTDAEMKSRLNAQITTNRAQRYALELKTDELNEQIELHNSVVEKNKRYINRNILQTKRNNARIDSLNASIDYSRNEGTDMDSAIEKSKSMQSEVDNLLGQNPAPSASR